jgi:hypothetical protein
MSFADKLKFWKKEEPIPEYPRAADISPAEQHMPAGMDQMGMPRPMPGITEPPVEQQQFVPQAFGQQQQMQSSMSTEQQLQLISSKLDTIKAQLETVLQRLERLERSSGEERPYQQRWRASI